ncbi:hypothetical protein ACFQ8T_04480 [Isoptericola sp. NPDC056618]|uniref:hypothetical protein n=1 Tax=Isoptericola sp. NPDC056618 TaxID=3345878 RepID=UPI0036A5CA6B
MFFYLLFRFWFTLARRCYAFCQAWMPTNHLVRWLDTDRGIAWGLPVGAALTPPYYLAMTWSGEHLSADGSAWWWVPTLWAALNAIKFAHVAIRSPFAWAYRVLRRRAVRRVDAYRRWRAA